MVKLLKENFTDSIENSWQYQRIKELEYDIEISDINDNETIVTIYFPDGDIYAKFSVKKVVFDDDDFEEMFSIYDITNDYKDNITDEVDYTGTYDECIVSCLYYFLTRY